MKAKWIVSIFMLWVFVPALSGEESNSSPGSDGAQLLLRATQQVNDQAAVENSLLSKLRNLMQMMKDTAEDAEIAAKRKKIENDIEEAKNQLNRSIAQAAMAVTQAVSAANLAEMNSHCSEALAPWRGVEGRLQALHGILSGLQRDLQSRGAVRLSPDSLKGIISVLARVEKDSATMHGLLSRQLQNLTRVVEARTLPVIQSNQAAFVSFTPSAIRLKQGETTTVAVEGRYLETVLSAGVAKDGRGVPEITAKLVQPWPGSKRIELKAAANAPVAQGYQLRFAGKAGFKDFRLDVPLSLFSLEVVVKKMEMQMLSTPIVNTNNQLQMPLNPDLVVSAIRIDPPDPSSATGFAVWATIRNQGSRDAFLARGWSIAKAAFSGRDPNLFLGSYLGSNFTLKAGGSHEVWVTKFDSYFTHEGDWTVTVRVDPDKQIAETKEDNNDRSINLTVRYETPPPPVQPADLIITDLRLEPEVATLEGNFELVGIVKNQGGTDATLPAGYRNVLDEIGDHIQQYLSAPLTIRPGETKEIRCQPRLLQAGTSTWTVIVDRFSHVVESDENNNTKTIEVTIE